jgi:hypothetical protein
MILNIIQYLGIEENIVYHLKIKVMQREKILTKYNGCNQHST